jgi:arabinofuranosyltransferase
MYPIGQFGVGKSMNLKLQPRFVIMAIISVAYSAYAALFIWMSSFVINGERFFALFDDSMISMTYARNLAHGAGLVWNVTGPRVEGFSNPLWVIYMAFFHLFPFPQSKMSLLIQLSGLFFFVGSLFFVEKIARRLMPDDKVGIYVSVLVIAFYFPFSFWSLLGTEVSVLILITTWAVWQAIQVSDTSVFSRWIYILLGISTLVRIDMTVPFLVIWGWLVWFDSENRRKHLIWGASSLAVFLGGQTVLRWLYYGAWLPNTYYLKLTGYPTSLRIERGFSVLLDFFSGLKFPLFLLPVLAFFFKNKRLVLLLLLIFLAQCAYSVYVGGDAWEFRGGSNRFVSVGMPFFLILYITAASYLLGMLGAWVKGGVAKAIQSERFVKVFSVGAMITGGLILFIFGAISVLYFDRLSNKGSLLFDLQHPANRNNPIRYAFLLQRPFFTDGSERYTRDALIIRGLTTSGGKVAVEAAGNLSYFLDRFSIDMYGKSDAYIAHEPVRISTDPNHFMDFRPGHIKWDYAYSIGQLAPDVIVELIQNPDGTRADPSVVDPYLSIYDARIVDGHPMYFRKDSVNIDWSQVHNYPPGQ